jgi:uncharacterized protein YdaU (DUF1376 family)
VSKFNGKKPVYHQWDEPSFMMDTMHLPWLERLLYRALLQGAFHCSTRPDIPDDDLQLQRMLCIPESVWTEHKADVRAMFQAETVNDKKVLFQNRLRKDWTTLEDMRRKRSEAGKWSRTEDKSGIGTTTPKNITQASPEVQAIMTAVVETCGKTPTVADVQHLLAKHTAEVIVGAFNEHAADLNSSDLEKAEFTFFRRDDGAGGDVICRAWEKRENAKR